MVARSWFHHFIEAQRTMNEDEELRRYLEAAFRQTVPTPEDERRLAAAARAGDVDSRQRVIDVALWCRLLAATRTAAFR